MNDKGGHRAARAAKKNHQHKNGRIGNTTRIMLWHCSAGLSENVAGPAAAPPIPNSL